MRTQPKLLTIIIPAFNEQKTLPGVLKLIPKKIKHVSKIQIVVIDDGSVDLTSKVAVNRAFVVRHIINRGLGAAITTGFRIAKKNKSDCAVTIDADGQHDPKYIPLFVDKVINEKFDVVVGSRLLSKKNSGMPLTRKFVNRMANIITWIITGFWTTDSQSGFRAFSKKAIENINLTTQRMEVSSEVFREIKKNNFKYCEVPIKSIYTDYSLKKGQSIFNAPNVFFKLLIRTIKI